MLVQYMSKSSVDQLKNFANGFTSNEDILRLSVCQNSATNEIADDCLVGSCLSCTERDTLEKVKSQIASYEEICQTEVVYPDVFNYRRTPGGPTTTVVVEKTASLADLLEDLVSTMYTNKASGTGPKVKSKLVFDIY